jgi:hypothetical protein
LFPSLAADLTLVVDVQDWTVHHVDKNPICPVAYLTPTAFEVIQKVSSVSASDSTHDPASLADGTACKDTACEGTAPATMPGAVPAVVHVPRDYTVRSPATATQVAGKEQEDAISRGQQQLGEGRPEVAVLGNGCMMSLSCLCTSSASEASAQSTADALRGGLEAITQRASLYLSMYKTCGSALIADCK